MNKERLYHVRQMRKSPTRTEEILWDLLRSRKLKGFKFRRQHPIGPYIADFCCLQKRAIVELDGAHHLAEKEEDEKRTQFLMEQGFSVIRFWNSQIEREPDAVLARIENTLSSIRRDQTMGRAKLYHWSSPLPSEGEGAVAEGDRGEGGRAQ